MIWRCWTRTYCPRMVADYNRLVRAPRTKSTTKSATKLTGYSAFRRAASTGFAPDSFDDLSIMPGETCGVDIPGPESLHVKRFGSGDLAVGIGGNLVDAGLGLPQQFFAAALQRLAALIDRDRFLKRHLAVLEPLHDRFELLDRALEGKFLDVALRIFGHIEFPNAPRKGAESNKLLGAYCGGDLRAHQCGDVRCNRLFQPLQVV